MDGKFIKNVLKIAISNIFIILSGVVSGFFLPLTFRSRSLMS